MPGWLGAGWVLDLVQNHSEARDLVRLRVHVHLRHHDRGGVVEDAEQVHRRRAVQGGPHRLAIDREHPTTSPSSRLLAAGGQVGAQPGSDRGLQGHRIDGDQ
jgi:hypothetical protein